VILILMERQTGSILSILSIFYGQVFDNTVQKMGERRGRREVYMLIQGTTATNSQGYNRKQWGERGVEPVDASCPNWLQPLYANQTPDPVSQRNSQLTRVGEESGRVTLVHLGP
jgi:hypothetical protein